MVWYGTVWYGRVWYGMVWYGMVRYGTVWYGMVWICWECWTPGATHQQLTGATGHKLDYQLHIPGAWCTPGAQVHTGALVLWCTQVHGAHRCTPVHPGAHWSTSALQGCRGRGGVHHVSHMEVSPLLLYPISTAAGAQEDTRTTGLSSILTQDS